MFYVSALLLLLGLAVNSQSASIYITVVQNCSEVRDFSTSDLSYCTSKAQKCCTELNDLGTKTQQFNSLLLSFQNSSTVFLLHNVLTFKNYSLLEFHGAQEGKSVIACTKFNGKGAGLTFTNISNFSASNIVFKNCGNQRSQMKGYKILWSALVFDSCENVRLSSVIVQESTGFGVSMFDCMGDVYFENCLFSNNSAIQGDTDSGGGGAYLEVTSRLQKDQSQTTKGVYKLLNCTFTYNKAYTVTVYPGSKEIRTFGQGGGLLISFKGNASNHHFELRDCIFINNSAAWGGGLHVFLTNSSHSNTIVVDRNMFRRNKATAGGGGMAVYMLSHSSCILKNNFSVVDSTFVENHAKSQGGGTLIHSLLTSGLDECNRVKKLNSLRFESCYWYANTASYSAAIDITTKVAIEIIPVVPVFSNCTFKRNIISSISLTKNSRYRETLAGKAAVMVLGSKIKFENSVLFQGNIYTALYAISSEIKFSYKTNATFLENRGRYGGAIALFDSILTLGNYSLLNFTSNKAYELGGAIYFETQGEHELHQNIHNLNCFIHCKYCKSVTLSFQNNFANSLETEEDIGLNYSFGKSIFAESFLSCVSRETVLALTNRTTNVSAFLNEIANFQFIDSDPYEEVVSSAAQFTISAPPTNQIIPGKEFEVPLITTDSFGHELKSDYKAFQHTKRCGNGSITIDPKYVYLPTNKLKVYGDPGSRCNITIEREDRQLFYLSLDISVVHCPPGLILSKNERVNSLYNRSRMVCVCAHHLANGKETYKGIWNCDDDDFQVKIKHYYWAGYESEDATPENLVTAFCPRSFCTYNTSFYNSTYDDYILPSMANKTILDRFVCSEGRTGKICGSCKMNYSVYFHSPNFHCKENHLCSVGWLFYLLSEILTLTLIFAVILYFNISFTTGALNGFIFYAQIIDVLSVTATNNGNNWTTSITKAAIFIYHFLNLDFFYHDSLSFCLWKGATTLDTITMKYLTIVLAFILVFAVVITMNLCTVRNFKYYSTRLRLRLSFIHGISTFLVISFAQTVRITFLIFAPGFIVKRGNIISSYQVLYQGGVQLFGSEHLKYVIPGLVLFLSIVAIPTFFLMCYPLGFKAIYRCGVNETKITKLHQIFCIVRLRPLFDSFQGCYKDKYRCFAGLYFIYRISILASSSYSYGTTQLYVLIQVQVSLILLMHCLSHPYKRGIYNVLDALLLANIAVINCLSIFIHTKTRKPLYKVIINVASAFQALFISLPLVLLLIYTVVKVILKVKARKKKKGKGKKKLQDDLELEDIPFRLLDESETHVAA